MSFLSYKNEKSCGVGLQSFIDQFNDGLTTENFLDSSKLRSSILDRLETCINQRFEEQNKFDKIDINHLNIIKVYFDFYEKMKKYFDVIFFILYSNLGRLIKINNVGYFNHTIYLELTNGKLIPFTDVSQKTIYLADLDFNENFSSHYNRSILKKIKVNWLNYDDIKFIIKSMNTKNEDEHKREIEDEEKRREQEEKLAKYFEKISLKFKPKRGNAKKSTKRSVRNAKKIKTKRSVKRR